MNASRSSVIALLLLRAPREEVQNALGEIRARSLRLLQIRLELEGVLIARLERVIHCALGRSQRLARLRGDLSSQLAHLALATVLRNDPVEHAQTVRIRSGKG